MNVFYLAGQKNFDNQGRLGGSTLEMLKIEFEDVEVLGSNYRPDLDSKQWPDAALSGCRFVRVMPYPHVLKLWGGTRRYLPFTKHIFLC